MGAKTTMCIATVCISLIVLMGVGQDGVVLPIDNACQQSNECVSVRVILARDDSSLPQYMTIYRPLSDFITFSNAVSACVMVGGKICVENNSNWTYEFGRQYMLRGYDGLEIDLMLDNGKIISVRKRRPKIHSAFANYKFSAFENYATGKLQPLAPRGWIWYNTCWRGLKDRNHLDAGEGLRVSGGKRFPPLSVK